MQFVQIKPCNLYQTAQEQLKKAEEVKKIKEIRKEEPEDWQNVSRVIQNILRVLKESMGKSVYKTLTLILSQLIKIKKKI